MTGAAHSIHTPSTPHTATHASCTEPRALGMRPKSKLRPAAPSPRPDCAQPAPSPRSPNHRRLGTVARWETARQPGRPPSIAIDAATGFVDGSHFAAGRSSEFCVLWRAARVAAPNPLARRLGHSSARHEPSTSPRHRLRETASATRPHRPRARAGGRGSDGSALSCSGPPGRVAPGLRKAQLHRWLPQLHRWLPQLRR